MNNLIDLHMHSTNSDGFLSPKEIIEKAIQNNVKTLSITDHDTISAYTKDFFDLALENEINIITGVEISTKLNNRSVHVLGYNIDINNKELQEALYKIKNSRHIYLKDVSTKLNELGYIVNYEELDKVESVTKAHISLDIVSNPKNKELLLKVFNHIPNKGEFIETIMNKGCPGFIKKESLSPKEGAELIRNAGGKVVLAHPVAYKYETEFSDEDVINIIKDIKADGIEANYIYIDRDMNKINDIVKWNNIANDLNLFTTIGSDFHNSNGISPEIGLINENIKVNIDEIINNLK